VTSRWTLVSASGSSRPQVVVRWVEFVADYLTFDACRGLATIKRGAAIARSLLRETL
jgi:hypothetical protein